MASATHPDKLSEHHRLVYDLRSLRSCGAMLHFGAHPDDEEPGIISYLWHRHGIRSVYWSATRGEGGQNRVNAYLGDGLGLMRSWESVNARSVDGGGTLFGPFRDFGFSKSAPETLGKWGGGEATVREVVRAIRKVQPQLVISRWVGSPADGHGHHRAVGEAVRLGFEQAGLPDRFPELTAIGLPPWQPLKLYTSTDNSQGRQHPVGWGNFYGLPNPELEVDGVLRVDTGEYDPISGLTYQERGWLAYNQHRTQGLGLLPTPGRFFLYYKLEAARVDLPARESSFLDGWNDGLSGLAAQAAGGHRALREALEPIEAAAARAAERFDPRSPDAAVDALLEGLDALRALRERLPKLDLDPLHRPTVARRLDRKCEEFESVLVRAVGADLQVEAAGPRVSPGEPLALSAGLWSHRSVPLEDVAFTFHHPEGWEPRTVDPPPNDAGWPEPLARAARELRVPAHPRFTTPYWLREPGSHYRYAWPEDERAGEAFAPPEFSVEAAFTLAGRRLRCVSPALYRSTFAGGYRELPPSVVPPVSLKPAVGALFLPSSDAEQSFELRLEARSHRGLPVEGTVRFEAPRGWRCEPARFEVSLPAEGAAAFLRSVVTVPAGAPPGSFPLRCLCEIDGEVYSRTLDSVRCGAPGTVGEVDGSNCVAEAFLQHPAELEVRLMDVRFLTELRYGVIAAEGTDITEHLGGFGMRFEPIAPADLPQLDLAAFDGILVGPRAYLLLPKLRENNEVLLDYVRRGGTLVVEYQGYPYQDGSLAPYPFRYSHPHDRVCDEEAEVTILEPDHPIFHVPNEVTRRDFEGWRLDRGMYFMGTWHDRYQPLLSCADPGEDPKEGGLMVANVGRGTFIYAAYSFFRQVPRGVTGAFRLLANILAQPAVRIMKRKDFLRGVELFESLDEDQLGAVARLMSDGYFADGEYLCREGDEGHEMFIVLRGQVDVLRGEPPRVLASIQPGECVGERAALGNVRRTASLRAAGPTEVLIIAGSAFERLMLEKPEIGVAMVHLLVERLGA